MADAGIAEAMLVAETLGESYAVPGIMESVGLAGLGESYAVPGIMSGTSSLMGGASPWAMYGADMAAAGYPEMAYAGLADAFGGAGGAGGALSAGEVLSPEALSESYWKQALGAPEAVPGTSTLGGNWYDMFFKPGGPQTGGIVDFLKSMNMAGQLGASTLGGMALKKMMAPAPIPGVKPYSGPLSRFKYDPNTFTPYTPAPPMPAYRAQYASGGIADLSTPTGPVERLSQSVVGSGGLYPQSQIEKTYFSTPTQMPASAEVLNADYDTKVNPYTGMMMASGGTAKLSDIEDLIDTAKSTAGGMRDLESKARADNPNALAALEKIKQKKLLEMQHSSLLAKGGITALREGAFVVPADVVSHMGNGSTDAGIAMLQRHTGAKPIRGGGDGMSDSIATSIEGSQPARVADGEAVIEPEQVKKIGKGSPEKGAKKLYAMMDKVRKARTGTTKQGRQINPAKYMPA